MLSFKLRQTGTGPELFSTNMLVNMLMSEEVGRCQRAVTGSRGVGRCHCNWEVAAVGAGLRSANKVYSFHLGL